MMKNKTNRYLLFLLAILFAVSCKVQRKAPASQQEPQISALEQAELTALFIEANKEKIIGNFGNAKSLFAESIRRDNGNHAAIFELANILALEEQFTDAILLAQEAYRLDKSNKWYALLLFEMYKNTGRTKEAVKVLSDIIKKEPDNIDYYFELAHLYMAAGDVKNAIKTLNNIEKKIGLTEEVSVRKHLLYLYANKNKKALDELKKLSEAFPDNTGYLLLLAEAYLSVQKVNEAFEIYEEVLRQEPDNTDLIISLVNYYRTVRNDTKAFEYTIKAFANPTLEIDEKINILLAYYQFTEFSQNPDYKTEAYILLDTLIAYHPLDAIGYSMYADFLVRDERFEEARDMLLQVIRKDKYRYLVWEQLLSIELAFKNYQSLDTLADVAIEVFPEHATLYLFSGYASFNLKNYEKTVQTLKTGVLYSVFNEDLTKEFYLYLGESHNHLKQYEESDAAFEKAISIDPRNAFIMNNYSYYLSLRGEKLERAKQMAEKANELLPNTASFQDTYAWVLYQMEDYQNALIWVEKAISNNGSGNAVIIEHYGDILFRLQQPDEALRQWEKARELGNGSDLLEEKIRTRTLIEN